MAVWGEGQRWAYHEHVVELLEVQGVCVSALSMLDLENDGYGLGSSKRGCDGNEEIIQAKSLDDVGTCKATRDG